MGAPAGPAPLGRPSPEGRLVAVNVVACILLLVQYLLGMAVNLYVILPARHPGAAPATISLAVPRPWAG